jgi:hypothetical protein
MRADSAARMRMAGSTAVVPAVVASTAAEDLAGAVANSVI